MNFPHERPQYRLWERLLLRSIRLLIYSSERLPMSRNRLPKYQHSDSIPNMRLVWALLVAAVLAAVGGKVGAHLWGTFDSAVLWAWGGYAVAVVLAAAGVALWHRKAYC